MSVGRSVGRSVCVCICSHVFSRTVAAVDTKRGYVGMCNGRSAQQESGAGLGYLSGSEYTQERIALGILQSLSPSHG